MESYSIDLRAKVLAAYDRGMKTKKIAESFGVSASWARRVKQRRREHGELAPRPRVGKRRLKIDRGHLAELVGQQPDATLAELRDKLGINCSLSAIWTALHQLGLSFKKTLHAAEQDRPDVAQQRAEWILSRAGIDPRRLIFIDETWAKTNMTRVRGRAPRGERLIAKVPHGHWKTTTLIGALDITGVRCSMQIEGAIDADSFESFVEHVLAPKLSPGDIVVMDNLSSHKGRRVRTLIEARGATLVYLPPYSPDFNPIELAFSKIKQLLRSLGARTVGLLWNSMQGVLDGVTRGDAVAFFRHCGLPLHED